MNLWECLHHESLVCLFSPLTRGYQSLKFLRPGMGKPTYEGPPYSRASSYGFSGFKGVFIQGLKGVIGPAAVFESLPFRAVDGQLDRAMSTCFL